MRFRPSLLPCLSALRAVRGLVTRAGRRNRDTRVLAPENPAAVARRVSWHQPPYKNETLDVAAELEAVLAHMAPFAANQLTRIDLALCPHLAVQADPAILLDLLTDIVSDSIASVPAGHVLLSAWRQGSMVHITACDDGAGYRGRRIAALRAATDLAALQGGGIDIRVQPGEGTTVTLRLPAPVASAQPPAEPRSAQSVGLRVVWPV
jgi:signal transduction histidine kinase